MAIAKPSSRDTKAQILKSFDDLHREYKDLEKKYKEAVKKGSSRPAAAPARPAPARAATSAKVDSSMAGIIASLSSLKESFGDATSTLSGKLRTEALALAALGAEIEDITSTLKELHEIEVDEDPDETLASVIAGYETKSEEGDEELTEKRDTFNDEMNKTRKAWEKEQQEYSAKTKERDSELRLSRRRESTEYQYDLEKTRKSISEEDSATEKEQKRQLAEIRETKNQAWEEREATIAEKEQEYAEAHEKAEALEGELEKAIKKAKDSGAGIARQQAKVKGDLIAAQIDADKRTFELMIESRESTIADQARQIETLTRQSEATLQQAKDLASKALEGPEQSASFAALREIALKQAGNLSSKK